VVIVSNEIDGMQPVGQFIVVGSGDVGWDDGPEISSRKGSHRRYCGSPGKSARMNIEVAITVKYLCWEIVVNDMVDLVSCDQNLRCFIALRHFISRLGEAFTNEAEKNVRGEHSAWIW